MNSCLHKRLRSTVIFLEPTEPDQHRVAVITIACRDCAAPFEFAADLVTSGIQLSEDRREMRMEITEAVKGMVQ